MLKIAESFKYGKINLKNRIIFAPTSMSKDRDEQLRWFEKLAQGGCAMIIVGDVPVSNKGPMSLFDDSAFAHYRQIADIVHKYDCLLCAQLHQSDSNFKALLPYIPALKAKLITADDLRAKMNEQVGPYITKLSKEEIAVITANFAKAVKQAVKAGFDVIQIHGDRMIGSFSSSIFNDRKDEYGQSAENRARFACDIIKAVRAQLPDISIDYKLAVRQENPHYGNAGVLLEELATFVPLLEEAGVDSFHVTLADHSKLSDTIPPFDHPEFASEGCFLKFCDEVRKYTNLPLCGVGGLSDPCFIEKQLESRRVDCVAMSRQLIADPSWPNKVFAQQTDKIIKCIRCNKGCLGGLMHHTGMGCIFDSKKDQA